MCHVLITADYVNNSVNLPDGPFNPTNYSGTQVNFWGVAPAGGIPMPGATNPLGAVSLPYGTTPNQLGCMTNHMLQVGETFFRDISDIFIFKYDTIIST